MRHGGTTEGRKAPSAKVIHNPRLAAIDCGVRPPLAGADGGSGEAKMPFEILILLRSATLPLLDVCAILMRPHYHAMIPHDMGLYFRDTHDHLSQIVRITESLRETLLAAMQMNLSLVAVQQNDIVKHLAGWGAIVFVPTIVCSVYGMSFQHMPELQWQYGYPFTLGVTAVVCAWLYRRFKKNDWL